MSPAYAYAPPGRVRTGRTAAVLAAAMVACLLLVRAAAAQEPRHDFNMVIALDRSASITDE